MLQTHRRIAEVNRETLHRNRSRFGVRHIEDLAAVRDLRIVDEFGHIRHLGRRHADHAQSVEQLRGAQRQCPCTDERFQRFRVVHACRIVQEAWVVGEIRLAHGPGQSAKHRLARDGQMHPRPIAGSERVGWRAIAVAVATPGHGAAQKFLLGNGGHQQRHRRIEQGHIHDLAGSAALARLQGAQRADGGVHAG